MTEENKHAGRTARKTAEGKAPASRARRTTASSADADAGAAAGKKARSTARTARATAAGADTPKPAPAKASSAGTPSRAADAAAHGTAAVTQRVGGVAAGPLDTGRRAVAGVSRGTVKAARESWKLLRARGLVVAAATASAAVAGACYAAGRHTATRSLGPLTRATGGRL